MTECACSFRVGLQLAGLPLFSSENGFLNARNVPRVCVGWVFCKVTGRFGVVRLVLVFCLSYCEVSLCSPNVGFATCALGMIDDI